MTEAGLVEALLEGVIAATGVGRDLRGWSDTTGAVLPAQYLLLVRDRPELRRALRSAAEGLLELLDAADQAYEQAGADHCGKFDALAAAPDWLLCPCESDDSDPDVALILEREVTHNGDWEGLLEALHRAGSLDWQGAIRRCRELMRFERERELDLAALLGIPAPLRNRSVDGPVRGCSPSITEGTTCLRTRDH